MDNRHFNGGCPAPARRHPNFAGLDFSTEEVNALLHQLISMQDVESLVPGVNIVNIEGKSLLQPGNLTLEDLGAARAEKVTETINKIVVTLKGRDTRFVVGTTAERDKLLADGELGAGDEVFVIAAMKGYVLNDAGKFELSIGDPIELDEVDDLEHSEDMVLLADRAIADENGRRIIDEYITYRAAKRYLTQVYNQLFTENPPHIMYGYITTDMLSEGVKDLLGSMGNVVNLPDEEDLTKRNGVLKLADKRWNPNQASGMGRKMLRRNMVNGVNVLTQDMMSEENTIYIIQYDFDTQDTDIIIPKNCVLQFEGGTLKCGKITLNGTKVWPNGCIIEECIDATIEGTYAKGQCLFDTALGKPKWWNGTAWVDATGAEV